jgi:hypothetical protein
MLNQLGMNGPGITLSSTPLRCSAGNLMCKSLIMETSVRGKIQVVMIPKKVRLLNVTMMRWVVDGSKCLKLMTRYRLWGMQDLLLGILHCGIRRERNLNVTSICLLIKEQKQTSTPLTPTSGPLKVTTSISTSSRPKTTTSTESKTNVLMTHGPGSNPTTRSSHSTLRTKKENANSTVKTFQASVPRRLCLTFPVRKSHPRSLE